MLGVQRRYLGVWTVLWIKYIPREMNSIADKLEKEAVDKKGVDG
jgi:hypothetical protein